MDITPPPLPAPLAAPTPIKLARTGAVLAMLCIATSIVFVLNANAVSKSIEMNAGVRPSVVFNMLAKYLVGWRDLMQEAHVWNDLAADEMTKSLPVEGATSQDLFRGEILRSVFKNQSANAKTMQALVQRAPELKADYEVLRELEKKGAQVPEAKVKWFEQRHGWVAKLAHAQATGWQETEWQALRKEAQATTIALVAVSMAGFGVMILGLVMLIKTLINWRRTGVPKLVTRLDKGIAPSLLEAFALYLFAYSVLMFVLHQHWPKTSSMVFYGVALLFVIIALFWPRLRGMDKPTWRQIMGLHCGAGVLAEMRAGVLGWITGLPLLLVAAMLAPLITRFTGVSPTHPMFEELLQPGLGRWGIVVLAVIWAPLVEETMFRGLLFPGLSSMSNWGLGVLGNAFIFASIHPQGWAGVPALMAIAGTLSALRLTRGSLIAPMTAHALNNGLVTAMFLVVM